jgi:hypothetical protein
MSWLVFEDLRGNGQILYYFFFFFFFFFFVGAEPRLCSPDALRPVGLLCTA